MERHRVVRLPRVVAAAAVLIVAMPIATPIALAHAPLEADGATAAENATVIPDGTKSWAIYTSLPEDGSDAWFRFDLAVGEPLLVQLYVPPAASADFLPGLVVTGPDGFDVERPGRMPERATFEAFAPSAFRELALVSQPAPATGTYLVRVESPGRGGNVGLAIGVRETFTAGEWLAIPFRVYAIHLWEGQSPLLVFGPAIAVLLLGALLLRRRLVGRRPSDLLVIAGGLLVLATAVDGAVQATAALALAEPDGFAIVTATLIGIRVATGFALIRFGLLGGDPGLGRALAIGAVAGLAAVVWGGVLVGPLLAVTGGLVGLAGRRARLTTATAD